MEPSPSPPLKIITEGKAKLILSTVKTNDKGEKFESDVFYNPVQVFNRDLTLLNLKLHSMELKEKLPDFKGLTIFDALSASGLRTIRFLKELDDCVKKVYANDISQTSQELMKKNFELNALDMSKVVATREDANKLLLDYREPYFKVKGQDYLRFDVIDLDPYGSCIPFIDAAVQCANENTLICATFTDLRVLCGPDYNKCFYLYGTSKVRVPAFQENALRIALFSINSIANKYGKMIEPKLSYQSEFYLRLFFKLKSSRQECQRSSLKTGLIFQCENCSNFHLSPFAVEKHEKIKISKLELPSVNCNICSEKYSMGGPIWLAELNDLAFVKKLSDIVDSPENKLELASEKKIKGLLHGILNEKKLGEKPLAYSLDRIGKYFKVTLPSHDHLQSAFQSIGFHVIPSYISAGLMKTDAPSEAVFDIIKAWKFKLHGDSEEKLFKNHEKDSTSYKSIQTPLKFTPNFDFKGVEIPDKVKMFFPNPKNWGPKGKAAQHRKIEENKEKDSEKEDPQEKEEEENTGEKLRKKTKKD